MKHAAIAAIEAAAKSPEGSPGEGLNINQLDRDADLMHHDLDWVDRFFQSILNCKSPFTQLSGLI